MNHINFTEILKEKKLKITPQRIAILDELDKNGHSTVDEIFNKIKSTIPSVSLATVYKNILALQSVDILKSIKTPTQKQKYEINRKPHVHLFCKICEKLEDFEVDTDNFQHSCKNASNYESIDEITVLLTGVCKDCKNSEAKAI